MPETTAVPMDALLGDIGKVFTQIIAWFGDVGQAVIEKPIMILFLVAIPVISFVFGLVMRIVGRRGRRR